MNAVASRDRRSVAGPIGVVFLANGLIFWPVFHKYVFNIRASDQVICRLRELPGVNDGAVFGPDWSAITWVIAVFGFQLALLLRHAGHRPLRLLPSFAFSVAMAGVLWVMLVPEIQCAGLKPRGDWFFDLLVDPIPWYPGPLLYILGGVCVQLGTLLLFARTQSREENLPSPR